MVNTLLLCFFALQISCKAAPSEVNLVIPEHTEEAPKLDGVPNEVADQSSVENESENNQRQKRFYDYPGFGYPPFGLPPNFPYLGQSQYSKRDESQNTGVYGTEAALQLIFNRLQGILSDVRQHTQRPPQQASIPAFIPVLFIPQPSCGCTTNSQDTNGQVPSRPVNGNDHTQPNQETTTPALPNRFPDLEDTQQNWGIVSGNESNVNVEGDGNRPISFDPIVPQAPIDIPVPPVEHGSVQAGAEPQQIPTTTFRPIASLPAKGSSRTPYNTPTICDGAVISCCLRSPITPSCFALQGCPDPSRYGNPCDPEVVLNVVRKLEHFLKQKNS
ncbi:uncharacterized protein LOC124532287 [Vanessa cardui]|uniref:uncharacterized protein LOC124532287 n=1 Tax=Vanessa cardui TaxID=171605 RepID=UPI001F13FEA0|nr:uncharacterized protein LOC124532287 [Vanessa cardui]